MKYKIAFIILSITLMIGTVLYIAYDRDSKQYKVFNKDGYILSYANSVSANSSVKYYFNAGVKYKNKYPSNIVFSDIDGNEVAVENNNILHYLDGSISLLKKSVIINTDELNSETLKYYNIFEEKIMEHSNGTYYVTNAGKKISFTNFIIKVSDDKYLLVSKDLKLKTTDNERMISGYLELNIIDGDIVRLENQELSMQTISSDTVLFLGEKVKLDLSNNKIFYEDEEKFSLAQLVIDSDDNIPLGKDDEEEETTTKSNNNNSSGGTNNGINNNNNNDYEEVVEEETKNLPNFSLISMDVTSNKISSTIKVVDESNMLMGTTVIKITETGSGKTVYIKEESSGSYIIDVTVENLNPDTNYTLTINSEYIKDGIIYNRDFLVKNFRTELIGIEIVKNYFTKTSLSFTINAESYSKVKSAEVLLLNNKNEILKRNEIDINEAKDGLSIIFDDLLANTDYKIVVTNFLYEDIIIASGYELEYECKTLKNKPTFGNISTIIDKRNGVFTLKANRISDVDNGIENYKYAVYDARLITDESIGPVTVVEKSKPSSIDIPVDEITLFRGVPYTFKLISEFYDNEKYIEYESEFSPIFKMDGVQFPTLRFDPLNITFERIEGNLIINDDGNTISFDNSLITIVYTNSTGHSKSFTTQGNLSIPFSVNNLRANETYTISVYTTVNLQDGNEPIDNCFVGSVIVKTEEAKELFAKLNVNSGSVTDAFAVAANLNGKTGTDNLLEASTMTGLLFNLYSGQSTTGTLVKSVKKVDRNLAPYISDLKETYYDKEFIITPEFFGVSNSDMQEEFYTIEIASAYDYTDYKNVIPIQNRIITVKSNGFIPDLPPNINDALEVSPIRNKDAGDKYRADLKADTIIGYKVKGTYDNSRLYAKYLKYYIYNDKTGVLINPNGTIVPVDSTGVINHTEFYLEDGSSYEIEDTDFRRGNNYYFTYEAYLDLNFDGIAETKYPYQSEGNDIILKSEVVSPLKQESTIKMYPSISTSNTMTVKYMIKDIDNTLVTNLFYNKINGVEKSTVNIEKETPSFATATLTNLSSGYLGVEVSEALMKETQSIKRSQLIEQYFDTSFNLKQLSFHTVVDVNRLIISIIDYDANLTHTKRIAALKVTFKAGAKTIIKDNMPLEYDSIIIDLAELKDLVGQDITISVEAYYDSGITGFDITGSKLALQNIMKDGIGGNYLTINKQNNLREDFVASGSIYNMSYTPTTLVLNNLSTSLDKTLTTVCDQKGISYNYEYLIPKKLNLSTLVGDGTEIINFTSIIPGFSILNEQGKLNIISTLRSAQINLKFYGADASQIKDNKFYVELYETNESGTISKLISTTDVTVVGINHTINLNNLNPKTQYFIKIFAYVNNGTEFVKTQLYDVDFKTNTKIHYFSTLSVVGITNVNARFSAANYNTKNIIVTYNLSEIVGYDKIKYKLYKYVKNDDDLMEKVLVNQIVGDDIIFNRSMIKYIPCPPGSDFTFDTNYNLEIVPVAYLTIDGEQIEIELDDKISYDFYLEQLRLPFVGIMGRATDDLGLEFKISIADVNKIIVNGVYNIKILNSSGKDITPVEYKNVDYSITTLNNTITILNLERATNYTLVVTTYIDRKNNITDIEKVETTYVKSTLDDSGIDIGNLYTSMNSVSKSKIDLLFYNSYKLTYINEIRYSIYNFSGYAQNGTESFIPTQIVSPDGNYYLFTLPETLPSGGLYYIELQFLYEGRLVKYASIEHSYVAS